MSDLHHEEALHHDLVERLTHELRPIGGRWSPWRGLGLWAVVALASVGLAAVGGLREDLGSQLVRPAYLLTLACLLAGAALGAATALLGGVPGRIGGRQAEAIGLGLLGLGVATTLLGDRPDAPSPIVFDLTGLRCIFSVAAFGFLPWLVLFRALRRAAPLDGWAMGLCAGAAACLVGAAAVRIACPFDHVGHLVVWHGLPVVFWATVSAAVGGVWFGRWLVADDDSDAPAS